MMGRCERYLGWMGYGYFSNIIEKILGFGNAQNGVLKIIIDSGIIGLIGYVSGKILIYHFESVRRN